MAPKKTLSIDGVKCQLYEQSIKVEGFADVFFLKRPVTEADAIALIKKLKEDNKILGNIEDKTLEHERMRFRTMTPDQLRTRLNKITKQEKLWAFILLTMAGGPGMLELQEEAIKRMTFLKNSSPKNAMKPILIEPSRAPAKPPTKVNPEPKTLKRSIEF